MNQFAQQRLTLPAQTESLNADLTFASTTQIMTIRHSISGEVITPLDERAGRYHADRINSTQAIEWGGPQQAYLRCRDVRRADTLHVDKPAPAEPYFR